MRPLSLLADEVGDLSRRLAEVSAEIRQHQAADAVPAAVPTPPPAPVEPPPYPVHTPVWTSPPPPKPTLFEKLGKDGAGSRVLAWVGGAITLLGVVLLLVLAVQRGWLGPLPRVLGGAALGGALIGIGAWVHRSPTGRTGAFALAATGIAALYLDTIAATTLFPELPRLVGLLLALMISVAGLLLAARWDERVLAIAVVVGCVVCSPLITHGFTAELVAFLLILQCAAIPVQLVKGWTGVTLAAGFPPVMAAVLTTVQEPAIAVVLVTTLVGTVLGLISARHEPRNDTGLVLLSIAAVPTLVSASVVTETQAVAMALAVFAVMLAVWGTGKWWPRGVTTVAATVSMIAGFQATAIQFDGSTRSALVMGEAIVLAVVAMQTRERVAWWGSLAFGVVGGMLAVATDVPPSLLTVEPWGLTAAKLTAALLASVLIVGVSVLVPWAAVQMDVLRSPAEQVGPWIAAGVTALYGAAGIVLCVALLVLPDRTGFLLGHVLVTVSWTVAALVLLLRGIAIKPVRVVGLVLVGAAVVKLVLFDLATLDGIARVAAFLGAGLVLLAAGTRYARLVSRQAVGELGHTVQHP